LLALVLLRGKLGGEALGIFLIGGGRARQCFSAFSLRPFQRELGQPSMFVEVCEQLPVQVTAVGFCVGVLGYLDIEGVIDGVVEGVGDYDQRHGGRHSRVMRGNGM
jgi:hypothetical protein